MTLRTLSAIAFAAASGGGIFLIEGGKLIGAVGCSGGTDSQDQTVCTAAADTINK
jgi:glc operon protein GlcG